LFCRLLLFLLLLFFRKRRISRAKSGLGSSSGCDEMSVRGLRDIVVGGAPLGKLLPMRDEAFASFGRDAGSADEADLGVAGDDEEVEDGIDGLAEEREEGVDGDGVLLLAFAGDLSEGSEAAALGAGDLAVEEDGVDTGLGGI
jgi:hypothetical protein